MLKLWLSGFMIMFMGEVSFSHGETGIPANSVDNEFPNLHQVEDYYSCPPEYSFCTISMKLIPQDDKSDIWTKLESWSVSNYHYNRTVVHRTLCIPPCSRNGNQIKHFAESKTNKELEAYNLTTQMLGYDCMNRQEGVNDIMSNLVILVLHLGLVVAATLYDLHRGSGDKSNIVQKIVLCFSVMNFKRTFYKTSKPKNSDNLYKLTSMDGFRVIFAMGVVAIHTTMGTINRLKNPQEFEQNFEMPLLQGMMKFSFSIISVFFVMSSWLLTRQILNLHFSEGEFSMRHCIIRYVHRIGRIWPLLFYTISVLTPMALYLLNGPGNYEILNVFRRTCNSPSKYWTFLHVTNLFRYFDICHVGLWSLTLEMQYYLLNIIFCYVILNYKMDIKKSLAILVATTYFIYAFQIYSNNVSLSIWLNIELIGNFNYINKLELSYIYYGFFVNYIPSLIGILFGYIDFQTRNMKRPVAYEKMYVLIAMSLVSSFLLYNKDYSVLATSFLAPIIKATFCLGMAMILYGLSRNIIRGPIKWMLEHKHMITLADFSYAIYLFHFSLMGIRGSTNSSTFEFTIFRLFLVVLQNIIISLTLGVFGTATISLPTDLLKHMILPPIRRKVHGKEKGNGRKNGSSLEK